MSCSTLSADRSTIDALKAQRLNTKQRYGPRVAYLCFFSWMPLPHRRGAGSLFWVIRIFFLPSLPDRTATGFLLYPDRDPAASQDRHNFFCISVLQISVRRKMLLFSIANNTPFRGAILSAVKSYAFGRPKHTYRRPKAMLRAGHVIAMLLAADWGGWGRGRLRRFRMIGHRSGSMAFGLLPDLVLTVGGDAQWNGRRSDMGRKTVVMGRNVL